jgi:hypothetical protein
MGKLAEHKRGKMKPVVWLMVAVFVSIPASAQNRYQHGTIVRMKMAECSAAQRGFMAAISGTPTANNAEICPEYTLVSEKVVYTIVGKTSSELIPLAEETNFRLKDKDLVVLSDDERHEIGFRIREMRLRADWEREQQASMRDAPPWLQRHVDTAKALRNEQ